MTITIKLNSQIPHSSQISWTTWSSTMTYITNATQYSCIKKNWALQQIEKGSWNFRFSTSPQPRILLAFINRPVKSDRKWLQDRWGGLKTDHGSDSSPSPNGYSESNVVQPLQPLAPKLPSLEFTAIYSQRHFCMCMYKNISWNTWWTKQQEKKNHTSSTDSVGVILTTFFSVALKDGSKGDMRLVHREKLEYILGHTRSAP